MTYLIIKQKQGNSLPYKHTLMYTITLHKLHHTWVQNIFTLHITTSSNMRKYTFSLHIETYSPNSYHHYSFQLFSNQHVLHTQAQSLYTEYTNTAINTFTHSILKIRVEFVSSKLKEGLHHILMSIPSSPHQCSAARLYPAKQTNKYPNIER